MMNNSRSLQTTLVRPVCSGAHQEIIAGTMPMKQIKPFLLCIVFLLIPLISNGCATPLPNVTEVIEDAPTIASRQISSSKGLLSPAKSKAVMDRLKRSGNPADILERHTVVMESITDTPLTNGNKVTLLADGSATYAAMFKAIQLDSGTNNIWQFHFKRPRSSLKTSHI